MQSSMESLRTLNHMLVQLVHAARERAELLNQAYEIIENELNESISSGLQNEVLWVCMATEMKGKSAETERVIGALNNRVNELLGSLENVRERLSSVCKERDFARQVGCLMKENIQGKERKFSEEIESLKMECGRFLVEKDELKKEKELLEKNIKDMVDEVGTLRRKIEAFEKEKKEMEMEKDEQRMKIGELEKETRELSQVVLSLRNEEGFLRSKVLELEKNCGEAMDREAKQAKEICALVEEKIAMGMNLERIMEEKDSASKSLESAMMKSEDLQRRIDKILDERDAARTVFKELKDTMKKTVDFLEEFLGDEVTCESEISGIQVVNRFHNSLLEAKISFNDLRDKMESTIINHGQVLTSSKNTTSLLCQSKEEKERNEKEEIQVAEKKFGEEVELIAIDLEAIKQEFQNKVTLAQDLKLKVEVMEKTIAGWQKKISFRKLVSSATTILAAVMFAHSAKRR